MGLTVLVADGDPQVVARLGDLLRARGVTVVAVAGLGREIVHLSRQHSPDVLIVDPGMGDLGGMDVVQEVGRSQPGTAVLVFTARDDDEAVVAAVRAGARGYLLKCAQDDDIVRAVRGVAAGEAIFGQRVAPLIISLMARSGPTPPRSALPTLTARERGVLDLVATGMGNSAIATRLRIAPKTVGNVIYSAVAKLGVPDRAAAIARMRGSGGCR